MLYLSILVYLAIPHTYASMERNSILSDLERSGRSLGQILIASHLYKSTTSSLDRQHWPEWMRGKNRELAWIAKAFLWPFVLHMIAEDLHNLRQFLYAHTLDESDALDVWFLEPPTMA